LPYVAGNEINAAESLIYEIIIEPKANHIEAINNYLGAIKPNKNDMAIIKEPISDDNYSHTAYSYNGNNWIAFDGNYNANNVYFDKDFTFTKPLGVIEIPESGSITIDAKGKNL
jgi:hypothetical protein